MYLAIDVGGTKTLVAVFNAAGEVIEEDKFATPTSYEEFLSALAEQVHNLQTKDFQRCVTAMPGLVDRKHGIVIAFGNLPWQNIPAEADIEKIASCPVLIENDANLAGLSEAH